MHLLLEGTDRVTAGTYLVIRKWSNGCRLQRTKEKKEMAPFYK